MHTPSIARRVRRAGVGMISLVVLLAAGGFLGGLWLVLDRGLDDLLADRLDLVVSAAEGRTSEDLIAQLSDLGIPAELITTDGRVLQANLPGPRLAGALPPGATDRTASLRTRQIDVDQGTLTIGVRIDGSQRALREAAALAVALAAVVTLLATWAWTRVGRSVVAPLEEVSALARTIGEGQTGLRADPDDPSSDVGAMASALDGALDALAVEVHTAREAEAAMAQFTNDAAHQLRTPLARIQITADLLRMAATDAARADGLDRLRAEISRAGRLIRDLLELARLEGHESRPRTSVDLRELVAEVARDVDASDVTVDGGDVGTSPAHAHIDPAGVREALSNLLDNGSRHATAGVTISLDVGADHHEIVVADDGPGVPANQAEQIFGRFVSLDGRGGSGLGLAIARRLVEASGGTLHYDEGFRMRLPAADTPPDVPSRG